MSCSTAFESGEISSPSLIEDEDYPSIYARTVFIKNSVIYSTHEQGVSISHSFGNQWANVTLGCQGTAPACSGYNGAGGVILDSNDKILVSVKGEIKSSADGGLTWGTLSLGSITTDPTTLLTSSTYLFSVLSNGVTGAGFAYSANNGQTWTQRSVVDSAGNNFARSMIYDSSTMYAVTGASDGVCVKKSANSGASWQDITPAAIAANGSACPSSMVFVGGTIFLNYSDGVYMSSDNGASWSVKTTADGLAYNNIHFLAYDSVAQRIWAVHMWQQLLSYSDDAGATWQTLDIGQPSFNVQGTMAAEDGVIVLGSIGSGIAVSTDSGVTFTVY